MIKDYVHFAKVGTFMHDILEHLAEIQQVLGIEQLEKKLLNIDSVFDTFVDVMDKQTEFKEKMEQLEKKVNDGYWCGFHSKTIKEELSELKVRSATHMDVKNCQLWGVCENQWVDIEELKEQIQKIRMGVADGLVNTSEPLYEERPPDATGILVEKEDLEDLISDMEFEEEKHDYDNKRGYQYREKYLPEEVNET